MRILRHEKCPYLEFFWSIFSPNAEKYGPEKLGIHTLFKQCLGPCQHVIAVSNIKGGSRAAVTSEMERFVITVND